jgi:hypothetical protein
MAPESSSTAAVADTAPPIAPAGFLAARAGDPSQITGQWPATAFSCEGQRSLQVLSDTDSAGVLIVMALPDSGNPVMSYPIALPDGQSLAAGTARMAVQRILFYGLAYAASDGTVELTRLDRGASGRFDVQLVDAATARESRYAGTFTNLRVERGPLDLCQLAGQPDSAPTGSIK